MIRQKQAKGTRKTVTAERDRLVRVLLPDHMVRQARAHAEMMGGRGPRLAIEAALADFFSRPENERKTA